MKNANHTVQRTAKPLQQSHDDYPRYGLIHNLQKVNVKGHRHVNDLRRPSTGSSICNMECGCFSGSHYHPSGHSKASQRQKHTSSHCIYKGHSLCNWTVLSLSALSATQHASIHSRDTGPSNARHAMLAAGISRILYMFAVSTFICGLNGLIAFGLNQKWKDPQQIVGGEGVNPPQQH